MSDPVECVGNASTVEHDVREVCCADGSVCRFWGHGEPEACTSACHEYFVPLYTQCSYLWSQRNMTLGTEPVEEAADRLDLSRLFTMCTTTGDEVGAIDTGIENECAATDLTAVIGGTANVHDYNAEWELCYLNVPRLSAVCGPDTASCIEVFGEDNMCDDPYSPYYVECLIFTGQCVDDLEWADNFGDTCAFYAEQDPGCTVLDDRGQRANCPIACNTCADPCHAVARTDSCAVERMRHWYRGDDWSCAALEAGGDGDLSCTAATECGFCDNGNMADWTFDMTNQFFQTGMCELAENAIEKACCFDAGLACDRYAPATCTRECARVLAVIDKCQHRAISNAGDDDELQQFWRACEEGLGVQLEEVTEVDLCYSAVEGYGNECDGQECCLAQSTSGFDALWAACDSYVQIDNFTASGLNGESGSWIDPTFVADPQQYATDNNCGDYVLQCPAEEVTAFYLRRHELMAGDCCSQDEDCAAGLVCDLARRVCTTTCQTGTSAVGINVGNADGGGCADRPTTTVGFDRPFPTCSAAIDSDDGVCDMENRCEGDRRFVCSEACSEYVGPACYVACPSAAPAATCTWAECSDPLVADCLHNCVRPTWSQDGVCDNGQDRWPPMQAGLTDINQTPLNGHNIYTNCPELPSALTANTDDGGDCTAEPAAGCVPGSVRSCLQILNADPSAASDYYTIDANCDGRLERVFCDMITDGGGWTKIYSIQFPDVWASTEWSSFAGSTQTKYSNLGMADSFRRDPDNTTALLEIRLEVGDDPLDTIWAIDGSYPRYRGRTHYAIWSQRHNPFGTGFDVATDGADYQRIGGDEEHPHCGLFNGLHGNTDSSSTISLVSDTDTSDNPNCWWMQVVPFSKYSDDDPGYLDGFYRTADDGEVDTNSVFHQWQTLWVRGAGTCMQTDADVRLVDPLDPIDNSLINNDYDGLQGRVEILYNEEWGTVCSDSWNHDAAAKMCQRMGYAGGAAYNALPASSSQITPPDRAVEGVIWLDDVNCDCTIDVPCAGTRAETIDGRPSELAENFCDCAHNGWGIHDCTNAQDAGAWCVADADEICDVYRYADECSVQRFKNWRNAERDHDFSCEAFEAQGMLCDRARTCGYCDVSSTMEEIDAHSPSICLLAEAAIEKVCCYDAGVSCHDEFPVGAPTDLQCSDTCAEVMAVVNTCRNGGYEEGSLEMSAKPGFDEFYGRCVTTSASLSSDQVTQICRAGVEGYATDCDGEECCFENSMNGWDSLWEACSSQAPAATDDTTISWLDPAFITPGDTCTVADTATFALQCPSDDVTAAYSGQSLLLASDCCSTDDDCTSGLICDQTRRVCTTECEHALDCPYQPTSSVGYSSPFATCVQETNTDVGTLPQPSVGVLEQADGDDPVEYLADSESASVYTKGVEFNIVFDFGEVITAGALIMQAPFSEDCTADYSPPSQITVRASNTDGDYVEVETFTDLEYCCSSDSVSQGFCETANMDHGLDTQRLQFASAPTARFYVVTVSATFRNQNRATVAEIAFEGQSQILVQSTGCEMQDRCLGDRRAICQTACDTYTGPVCLIECGLNPTSSRNFGEPAAVCDASIAIEPSHGCTARLRDGISSNQGRVELFYNGTWGSVCDKDWNRSDATVVCKQMGYDDGFNVAGAAAPPGGDDMPIMLADIECDGTEGSLCECSHSPWTQIDPDSCSHADDIGVFCYNRDDGEADQYDNCLIARELDICSMVRHQYGYWAGSNWGDSWSCNTLIDDLGMNCDVANNCGFCGSLPADPYPLSFISAEGNDMTAHFHCELLDQSITKTCCYDAGYSEECLQNGGLPISSCSAACAESILAWEDSCHVTSATSPGDMHHYSQAINGLDGLGNDASYNRQDRPIYVALVRMCRATVDDAFAVNDVVLCKAGLEGYAAVCDGEECCNEPLLRALYSTCEPIITAVEDTYLANLAWLNLAMFDADDHCDQWLFQTDTERSQEVQTSDAQCPTGLGAQTDLRHGDCCDSDEDCGGTLLCDISLRVCTAACDTDSANPSESCPYEPKTLIGFRLPSRLCQYDLGSEGDRCRVESSCPGQPGPEVEDIGSYGLCKNVCPDYVGPVCEIRCAFNERATRCIDPTEYVLENVADCSDPPVDQATTQIGDGICDDGTLSDSANFDCSEYNNDINDCTSPQVFPAGEADEECGAAQIRADTCMNMRHRSGWYYSCEAIEALGYGCDAARSCGMCPSECATRIVGADNSGSRGRVEIMHDGVWGTVCDDEWDNTDASVLCKSLGFSAGKAYTFGSQNEAERYEQAQGNIWLDNLECEIEDDQLCNCSSAGNTHIGAPDVKLEFLSWDSSTTDMCVGFGSDGLLIASRCADATLFTWNYLNAGGAVVRVGSQCLIADEEQRSAPILSDDCSNAPLFRLTDQFRVELVGALSDDQSTVFCFDSNSSSALGEINEGDAVHMWDACDQLENRHTNFFRADVEGGSTVHQWGNNDCGHWEDAGVICYSNPPVDMAFYNLIDGATLEMNQIMIGGHLNECGRHCEESSSMSRPIRVAEDFAMKLTADTAGVTFNLTATYNTPYIDNVVFLDNSTGSLITSGVMPTASDDARFIFMNFYCHGVLHGTSSVQISLQIGDVVNTFYVSKVCDHTCPGDYFLQGNTMQSPAPWQPIAGSQCYGDQDVDECLINHGGCDQLAPCTNTLGGFTCGDCPDGYAGDGYVGCISLDGLSTNIVREGALSLTCVPGHVKLRLGFMARLEDSYSCTVRVGSSNETGACSLMYGPDPANATLYIDATNNTCGSSYTSNGTSATVTTTCVLDRGDGGTTATVLDQTYSIFCSLIDGTPSIERDVTENSVTTKFGFGLKKNLHRLPPWQQQMPEWNRGDDCPWLLESGRSTSCPDFVSLAALWTFDESLSTDRLAFDASPDSHEAALVNFLPSPYSPWTFGVNGNGLSFASETGATSVNAGSWDTSQWTQISVALWIRAGTSASGNRRIIGQQRQEGDSDTNHAWALWLTGGNTGQFLVELGDGQTQQSTNDAFDQGSVDHMWQHIAFVYDGAALTLFHNGVPAGDFQLDIDLPQIAGGTVLLGGASDVSEGSHYEGVMDELTVFSRVLDPIEIASLATPHSDCGASSHGNSRNCRLRIPPASCADIYISLDTNVADGWYQIWPSDIETQLRVWCDMTNDGKTYFVHDDNADTADDLSSVADIDSLRSLCTSHTTVLDLVAVPSAEEVHTVLRPLLQDLGYDLTRASGVPLGFDYGVTNQYKSLAAESSDRSVDGVFTSLLSDYQYAHPDGAADANGDGYVLAGLGWGSDSAPGIEDFGFEDPMQAVLCSTNGVSILGGCMDPESYNYNPSATFNDGSCISFSRAPTLSLHVVMTPNLLVDSGFETDVGQLAPGDTRGQWTQLGPSGGVVKDDATAYHGSHSYMLHERCTDADSAGGIEQTVTGVVPGQFFLLEFMASGIDRGGARVDIGYVSAGSMQGLPFESLGYRTIGENGWKQHRHLVVAVAETIKVRFFAGPDNCVEVDQVNLVQVQAAGACSSVVPLDLVTVAGTATFSASSVNGDHTADMAVDGRQFTFWESEQDDRTSFGEPPVIVDQAWLRVQLNSTNLISGMSWTCYAVGWCPTDYIIWAADTTGSYTPVFSQADVTLGTTDGRPSVNAEFIAVSSSDWIISFPSGTRNGNYWHSVRELKIFVCQQFYDVQATSCAIQPVAEYNLNAGVLEPSGDIAMTTLDNEGAPISAALTDLSTGTSCSEEFIDASSLAFAETGGAIQFGRFTGFSIPSPEGLGIPIDDATEFSIRLVVRLDSTQNARILKLGGAAGLFANEGLEIRDADGNPIAADTRGASMGMEADVWYTIVVTADPSGLVGLYLDGESVGTWALATSEDGWLQGFRLDQARPYMVLFNDYGNDCVTDLQDQWQDMTGGMLHSLQVFGSSLSAAQVASLDTCAAAAEEYVVGSDTGCYGGSKAGARLVSYNGVNKVVYCDPVTDGGGWVLTLAYSNTAGSNDELVALTDGSFPTDPLGFSHTVLASALPGVEALQIGAIRMKCQSSGHGRLVHFTSTSDNLAAAVWGGGEDNVFISSDFSEATVLGDHTGNLPETTNVVDATMEDLTGTPFYSTSDTDQGPVHWSIRGSDYRWECDDQTPDDGTSADTMHQIWAKLLPGVLLAPVGVEPRSCKEFLAADNVLYGVDGLYNIVHPTLPGETLEVYCDMTTDVADLTAGGEGGYTYFPISDGVSTARYDEENSCTAIGLQLMVWRTAAHQAASLAYVRDNGYGPDYFKTAPGLFSTSAASFTTARMNSVSGDAPTWAAVDGGDWFLSAGPNGLAPNGDYTPGCWLGITAPGDLTSFNDKWCDYTTGPKYMCSTNDFGGKGIF